ncbi:MAG: DUF4131 domain-containing protein [Betaproteobacteria bacterium]|nr:MAG: DUF4131 domain-containing protein [Betaproteobacteria bacterium]
MRCVLLAFAYGVIALQQQAVLPPLEAAAYLVIAGAIALVAAWCARRFTGWWRTASQIVSMSSLAVLAGGSGFFYAAWRAEVRLSDELPTAWEGRDIRVIGVIDELPQPVDRGKRFAFAVERVLTAGAIVPSEISLAWYAPLARDVEVRPVPPLHAGERWQLMVRLKRPHGTVNPHGFDVEAWLLENGLRATGYVRDDEANYRLDAFAGRADDYVSRARESIRERILAALDGRPYAGVIAALAIGDERAIPAEQWQLFNRTGIGHLISISGLHITFFATLMGGIAFWAWKRSHALTSRLPARKAAAIAGVIAAFGYVLLAGFQIPAQRTLYMLSVAAIGLWLGRPGTASIVWLWALAVVLAWDPWASLTPGFWLSFGAVGLLLYIGVGRVGTMPAWREAVHAQAAITFGLIPLMLFLFQQISIVSPLANAVAIPVVTFIVVPLTLASIAVPWDALLIIAHAVFAWLALLLDALASLPAALWQQHAPPPWAALLGVLGVLWMLAPRGVPGRALGVVWLVPSFVIVPVLPPPGAFRVIVLDVGQGLAVLVQTHAMLRSIGVARLDAMIVSHQDTDHSGGTLSLMQTLPIGWVASSLPTTHPIVRAIEARGETTRRCLGGDHWTWDGVDFQMLHPVPANYTNPKLKSNDISCVLRVSNGAGRALLTGDIEARTEADLVRRDAAALRAELLVVPHHGSRTSSTPDFIAAVHPQIAAFTPGYRNRFRHPRPEIVERYTKAGARIYRTDYDGSLTLNFAEGASREPRREREHDAHYWREVPLRGDLPPLE